jgi:predicted dehydrogenase
MEAHWTAFLPKYDILGQLLEAEALGQITTVIADFGEWFPPEHRIFRPELAGGPMLDLGLYLVSFAVNALSLPDRILATSVPHGTGVQGQTGMILTHGDRQSVLHTTILTNTRPGQPSPAPTRPSRSTARSINAAASP